MTAELNRVFVLPSDVLLIPVGELGQSTRDRLNGESGDVAISRPLSRRPSSIVDANAAGLLTLFRTPSTVVDAILQYSRANSLDARVVLQSAFPLVERLVREGVLLPSDDERAKAIEESVMRGDTIGDFTVVDRVQMLEDVEIHRARAVSGQFVALKIARAAYVDRLRRALGREAAILQRLNARAAPRLVAEDLASARPWIALEWCAGVSPTRVGHEIRTSGIDVQTELLGLCGRIAQAYANLHEAGVLHGDVHDRNVLVDKHGQVTLLDFGISVVVDDAAPASAPRGGIPEFYDPQFAEAQWAGTPAPVLDAAAEQYSVAALLYLIVVGHSYCTLSMRREEALRQIVEMAPLSFAEHGAAEWPALERVLQRALSKAPADRYGSMQALADAIGAVAVPVKETATLSRQHDRQRFTHALCERLEPGGPLFSHGLPAVPLCSVNNGAAGIAYAFYRMAAARGDARLLACADAWTARARAWMSEPEAWYTRDGLVTKRQVGPNALYHSATGLYCVEALIALASGDHVRAEGCSNEFVVATRERTPHLDITLGKAGLVVGTLLMLEASPDAWPTLRKRGKELVGFLERRLRSWGPVSDERALRYLGVAHGWSGYLWTLLRWYRFTGTTTPTFVEQRLQELAALATPRGRGLAWTWSTDPRDINSEPHPAPTWCNGTAGHVHTWLEAHAAYGDDRYLDLAHAAAWNIWDDSRDAMVDACCGLVGRSYALLAMHRRSGDVRWRQRAEQLANRALDAASTDGLHAHRLYKGDLGVALLLDELEGAPDDARMPLFEAEGWRWDWR